MNYGYLNEHDFVNYFNDKYFCELDENSKNFLLDIFDNNIGNDEKIKSWKNRDAQKTDIFIKYKKYLKRVSIKCGVNNSVHQESLSDFKRYLVHLGIPYKIIEYYVSYHFGYAKDENGKNILSRRLTSEEYKSLYQEQLNIFNKYINKTRIVVDMIDRFVVKGLNSDYDINALISGTINDYVWINKYDLYDLFLSNMENKIKSPHASSLTIGPKARNLSFGDKYEKSRYFVCIRWHYIREEIEKFKQSKNKI